ncbi:hypothetical protein BJ912DRAFT_931010 [Pholiota molesta]|nr:hypothetical protein BJ912DRAFT_931010 [Pholiota molesta]
MYLEAFLILTRSSDDVESFVVRDTKVNPYKSIKELRRIKDILSFSCEVMLDSRYATLPPRYITLPSRYLHATARYLTLRPRYLTLGHATSRYLTLLHVTSRYLSRYTILHAGPR